MDQQQPQPQMTPPQPQMTPPQQPQWTPPPQQPTGWGGPGYGGPPVRPTGVTLAAVYLIVMGVLMTIAAIVSFIGGATFAGLFGGDAFLGLFAVVGVIILVIAILHFAAGIGSLQGKGWARWTGIILAIVFAILIGLSGLTSLGARPTADNSNPIVGTIIIIAIAVLYALSALALIRASAFFSYRR